MSDGDGDLTDLQLIERKAMVCDGIERRQAVIALVSAVREFRQAAKALLDGRYRDGEVDAVALHQFETAIEEIEHDQSTRNR